MNSLGINVFLSPWIFYITMFKFLQPTYQFTAVEVIDLNPLWQRGIRGLIFDLDDTLTRKNSRVIAHEVRTWLEQAQELGFKCYIVSNNRHPNLVASVSQTLQMPAIARAGKPQARFFLKALVLFGA